MFNLDFGSSFKPKGNLTLLAQSEFKGKHFPNSAKKIKTFQKKMNEIRPIIEYYDESIKKSRKDEATLFTNYLSPSAKSSIKTTIYDIMSNPSLIDSPHGDVVRMTDKVKQCIESYIGTIPQNSRIIKSNLIDAVGNPKEVRVFSLMTFVDEPEFRAISKIVLIDPFHLVIPSEHNGKKKEVVEREAFQQNKENSLCMLDYVNSSNI